jgi:hypothetical protein
MGGKGSGGRRVGAGRPRKSARQHWLTGDAGKRGLSLVERPADAGAKPGRRRRQKARTAAAAADRPAIGAAGVVPAILTKSEREFWEEWAPHGVKIGTLTDETRPGFVLLCQTAARVKLIWSDIEERGILTEKKEVLGEGDYAVLETVDVKAHPLWPSLRGLMARQEMLLARYGLAAIGKAPESGEGADDDDDELRRLLNVT